MHVLPNEVWTQEAQVALSVWTHSTAALLYCCKGDAGLCLCVWNGCSRCGGVMCKACTVVMELPSMSYAEPQKCCSQCQQGSAASRTLSLIIAHYRGSTSYRLFEPPVSAGLLFWPVRRASQQGAACRPLQCQAQGHGCRHGRRRRRRQESARRSSKFLQGEKEEG